MSEFINTIDALGDDTVIDSIIQKTITEFKDNRVIKVGGYVFIGCTALETVNLPNVKTFAADSVFEGCSILKNVQVPELRTMMSNSFLNCKALTTLHFPKLISIGHKNFERCSALTAVIFYNLDSVVTISGINNFNGTPIASGTGYIYVPKTLVDSYKSATNWSAYADQIRAIEDYPEICGG